MSDDNDTTQRNIYRRINLNAVLYNGVPGIILVSDIENHVKEFFVNNPAANFVMCSDNIVDAVTPHVPDGISISSDAYATVDYITIGYLKPEDIFQKNVRQSEGIQIVRVDKE